MWIALLGVIMSYKQNLNLANVSGLVLGFVGVLLLTTDHTVVGQSTSLIGVVVLLIGTVSWSLGMLYSKRAPLPADPVARSAVPLLVGAVLLLTTAGVTGEFSGFHRPTSPRDPRSGFSTSSSLVRSWHSRPTHGCWIAAPRR